MVRVVYLDQPGLVHVVRVDDAAIILVVLFAQQAVEFADEGGDVFAVGGVFGPFLAECVHVPARPGVPILPKNGQLVPGQQAEQLAVEQGVELGIVGGEHQWVLTLSDHSILLLDLILKTHIGAI